MQLIEGTNLANLVDYSFGDHATIWDERLGGSNVKFANATNSEFLAKAKEFEGKIMTLFIDNIRLYPRPVKTDTENDAKFVDFLMKSNNLLALCSLLPANGFIVFTGQEDTPIDQYIQLPFNVERIYAVNAIYNTDKVIPFPFGVQRKIGYNDPRLKILQDNLGLDTKPSKLLYINCGIERNEDRKPLGEFETNDWVTTRFDKDSKFFPYNKYQDFLNEIKDHKFNACPAGHAQSMDTHRTWETLYMRRVPIMIDHPYYRRLMMGFPVLFIQKWADITKELLEQNDHLYQEAQTMSMDKLDLSKLYEQAKALQG